MTATDTTLVIRHIPKSDPASFQVTRLRDSKTTEPESPPSPHGFSVEGRPTSDLLRELQWYLETFLDYPFRSAGRMFEVATSGDYSRLHLQISSDDARVLSWPWEALRDPEAGFLAQTCQIERRLNKLRAPQPLPGSLPNDRVNILLVVARPYGEDDVGFRSIARPLVEFIEEERLPAYVELLVHPRLTSFASICASDPASTTSFISMGTALTRRKRRVRVPATHFRGPRASWFSKPKTAAPT